ncbi:WD repeat-containing and planar cell polarity effector protein fritz homolog [Neocloeon triangulifer]|uniref:WD repeat-containing and planar cell polarity effector protein fritz homolog n=1 Tax=Neocloeon triangulifer TaxID=2078957 RepID=UPI00286F7094|nr:WD repeat-containing and planar cell polarity effector protein fritz homolog [Neocloeon triangulifer]
MLLGEAHFWTTRDDSVVIPDTDYGAFRCHDKKGSLRYEAKKSYTASRVFLRDNSGQKSTSPVKRDSLKELEELIAQQRVVKSWWQSHSVLQILFSSGIFAYIRVHPLKGEIEKITFDRYLLGKLAAECITDVASSKDNLTVTYSSNVISLISLHKPSKHLEKLSRQDPHYSTFELGGPSGRRLERKLSLNPEHNLVLVWWRYSQNELYPWSPMTKDCDRANLLIYKISESRLELQCFYKTEADPLLINFSKLHPNRIFVVEQKVALNGDVNVESSYFETGKSSISRASPVDVIQLKTEVCSVAQSPSENVLALGCIDGSVLLHSSSASILVKSLFIPYHLSWHPDGTLLLAANEKGQTRCYDLALTPVNFQITSETPQSCNFLDLSPYFKGQPHLSSMCWNKKWDVDHQYASTSDGLVFMMFSRGPCVALRVIIGCGLGTGDSSLTPERLVCMYLKSNLVECAINLLRCLSWDNQGTSCISSLHQIINYLLSKRLTPRIEVQLEAALGVFMSPTVPLNKSSEKKYGHVIHSLARRFFFHILRFERFDLAFRLAIDIGDRDLFLAIENRANASNNLDLVRAAVDYADQLKAESNDDSSSTSSHCSRSSCSQCDSEEHTETEVKHLELTVAKNPKVTFAETVTHIVPFNGNVQEDDDSSEEGAAARPLINPSLKVGPPPSFGMQYPSSSKMMHIPPSPNVSGLPVIDPAALRAVPGKHPVYLRGERSQTFQGASYRPPLWMSHSSHSLRDATSYNPETDDSALNVHIAWKSVTTLTDPRTRTSITQVSEAFETLLMPQASIDMSKVRPEDFAVAARQQPAKGPALSQIKSLGMLTKPSVKAVSHAVPSESEDRTAPASLANGHVVSPLVSDATARSGISQSVDEKQRQNGRKVNSRPTFTSQSKNEIGLPLRNFKAVFSEPVDV